MKTHELKTVNPFFVDIAKGYKSCEVRIYDRDFQVGDRLTLQEYDWAAEHFSGREIYVKITHVLTSRCFYGVKERWCVLSFNPSELTRNFSL